MHHNSQYNKEKVECYLIFASANILRSWRVIRVNAIFFLIIKRTGDDMDRVRVNLTPLFISKLLQSIQGLLFWEKGSIFEKGWVASPSLFIVEISKKSKAYWLFQIALAFSEPFSKTHFSTHRKKSTKNIRLAFVIKWVPNLKYVMVQICNTTGCPSS